MRFCQPMSIVSELATFNKMSTEHTALEPFWLQYVEGLVGLKWVENKKEEVKSYLIILNDEFCQHTNKCFIGEFFLFTQMWACSIILTTFLVVWVDSILSLFPFGWYPLLVAMLNPLIRMKSGPMSPKGGCWTARFEFGALVFRVARVHTSVNC